MSMTHKQMVCRHDHTSQQCSPARTVCDDCGLVCVTSGGQSQYDEIDRLRGLLREARPYVETQTEPPFRMGMNLLKRIDAALSPAPELQVVTTSTSQACPECDNDPVHPRKQLQSGAWVPCDHGTGRSGGKR